MLFEHKTIRIYVIFVLRTNLLTYYVLIFSLMPIADFDIRRLFEHKNN